MLPSNVFEWKKYYTFSIVPRTLYNRNLNASSGKNGMRNRTPIDDAVRLKTQHEKNLSFGNIRYTYGQTYTSRNTYFFPRDKWMENIINFCDALPKIVDKRGY